MHILHVNILFEFVALKRNKNFLSLVKCCGFLDKSLKGMYKYDFTESSFLLKTKTHYF